MVLLGVAKDLAERLLLENEQRIGAALDAFKKKRKAAG